MNLKIKNNTIKWVALFAIITMVISCNNSQKNTIIKNERIKPNIKNYYYINCDSIVQSFVDSCFISFFGESRFSLTNKKDAIVVSLKINLDGFIKDAEIFKNKILSENEKKSFIQYLLKQKTNTPCTNDYILENKDRKDLEKMKKENQKEFLFCWSIFVFNRSNE